MADNVGYTPGSGEKVATREVQYSGETAQAQAVGLVNFSGSDDAKTATDISDSNPLQVSEMGTPQSLMSRLLMLLQSPPGFDSLLRRQRSTAVIESGTITTVSTVSTVSNIAAGTITTVTGLTNIDGRNGSMLINATNMSAWADCHRSRIT
jgi:hypothetical protein